MTKSADTHIYTRICIYTHNIYVCVYVYIYILGGPRQLSKLLVSPLLTPIILPYTIPSKEFRLRLKIWAWDFRPLIRILGLFGWDVRTRIPNLGFGVRNFQSSVYLNLHKTCWVSAHPAIFRSFGLLVCLLLVSR